MKKRRFFYALPLVAMLLVACGDSEDNSTKETDTNKTEENEAATNNTTDNSNEATDDSNEATDATESKDNTAVTDVTKDKEELPFAEFSLDVDYPTGEYTLDYEKQFSGEEAELEDERKKSKIVGEEALNNLKPLLKKFTFDANTPDDQVEKQLFSIIKIDDDYTRIELDVQFHDGVEKEYIFTK